VVRAGDFGAHEVRSAPDEESGTPMSVRADTGVLGVTQTGEAFEDLGGRQFIKFLVAPARTSGAELDDPDGVQMPAAESDELVVAVGEVKFVWESSRFWEPTGYPGRGTAYGAQGRYPGESAYTGVGVCTWRPGAVLAGK
jgi:hypothetical protein